MSKQWTYDCGAPGPGVVIRTPEGRVWTRVRKQGVARKIVATFNFAKNLEDAVESGDIIQAKQVLAKYQRV